MGVSGVDHRLDALNRAGDDAWLILYTHDVQPQPSPFGCTPALPERCSQRARTQGWAIETVGAVAAPLDRNVNILYVCHCFLFPFPLKGGKIRPFNMIRHLSAPAIGDRAQGWRARRPRPRKAAIHALRRLRGRHGQRAGAGAHGGQPAAGHAVVDGLLPLPRPGAQGERPARQQALGPDLRALFVGGAVRRACIDAQDSTSATWTSRSGWTTPSSSPSRCRWATGSKA